MYVQRNTEVRSFNDCGSAKALSIAYYDCVVLDSGTQREMRISHNVTCGLSGSTLYFHIIYVIS